jgi:hypothetical protein
MLLREMACYLVLPIAFPGPSARSQSPASSVRQQSDENTTASAAAIEQRARSIVDHLLEVSKGFRDDYLQVRFQAQIADTLWPYDESKARRLLIDAFQAINSTRPWEHADKSTAPAYQGADSHYPLRAELLRIASKRDTDLAQKLTESIVDDRPDPRLDRPGPPSCVPDERASQSLGVAAQILDWDQPRAIELARAALKGAVANSQLVSSFITLAQSLRLKDPGAADDLFSYAISETRRHPSYALSNIRFLGLYCFPDSGGMVRHVTIPIRSDRTESTEPSPSAITQFLGFVYDAVMSQPDEVPPSQNARKGFLRWAGSDFSAIKLLLPYFDKYMPAKSADLGAKLKTLMMHISPSGNPQDDIHRFSPNAVQDQIALAETSRIPGQRDAFYDRAVQVAIIDQNFDEALALANKIGADSLRSSAMDLVRRMQAQSSLQKKDYDAAYTYTKQMPYHQQVGMLCSIASAVARDGTDKAKQLLAEALQQVQSFDDSSGKSSQLFMLASTAGRIDLEEGFKVMQLAVDQIKQSGYNPAGENAKPGQNPFHSPTLGLRLAYGIGMISLDSTFKLFALADFDRTLKLALAIEPAEASAMAQLSVCRAVLAKPVTPPRTGSTQQSGASYQKVPANQR